METTRETIPVLNIIGPVGIGKTSVAYAISNVLLYDYEQILPHAIIDLDEIRREWPAPNNDPFNMELGFNNLRVVWANYRAAGARCLIIPNVMESLEGIEKISKAVPRGEIFVVRLTAPIHVNHSRIRGRKHSTNSLNWHLARATQLAKELEEKKLEHIEINTADKNPREIAQEILTHWDPVQVSSKS